MYKTAINREIFTTINDDINNILTLLYAMELNVFFIIRHYTVLKQLTRS